MREVEVTPSLLENLRQKSFVLSIDALLEHLDEELIKMRRENAPRYWLSTLPPRR